MLKKEDWGGLTILSLLATIAFPPYFVHLMAMAALTELGHLWSTRLDRLQKKRLIEFEKEAEKELRKLDRQIARRIVKFLRERVAVLDNPRSIGQALTGSVLGDYWKYWVGDYRIVADIQDKKVCVKVVRLGNRREIYR